MIKYEIKTGDKVANDKARSIRDNIYKPALKGVRCRNCKTDTVIRFIETDPPMPRVKAIVDACFEAFKTEVEQKADNFMRPS